MSNTPTPAALRDIDGLAVIGDTFHALRGIRFAEGEEGAGSEQNDAEREAAEKAAKEQQETEEVDGEKALGDPGKKALDSMKTKWREAEQRAKTAEAKLAEQEAKAAGREAEHKAEQESARVKSEARTAADERIKKSEVRLAAAGKLADPKDAIRYLDLSEIEVDEDGEIDTAAVAAKIDALLKQKPYLAAQGGGRFQGGGDGGPRKETGKPQQYTKEEVARMTPQQIVAARREGRLDDYLKS